MRLPILLLALCIACPLFAAEEPALGPGTQADLSSSAQVSDSSLSPTPLTTPVLPQNLMSLGTLDGAWAISYERFIDSRAAIQFEADNGNQTYLGSTGVGMALRFYPIGHGVPTFYGGARVRVFEQNVWGNAAPGYYRGLRGGPQIGVRLPAYKDLVISYELAWSWDLSLYKSDPSMTIGDSWMAEVQYAGTSGRITDALSVGWVF